LNSNPSTRWRMCNGRTHDRAIEVHCDGGRFATLSVAGP
jgi:hypothetical protein